MAVLSLVLDIIRDSKHIVDWSPGGVSGKFGLWASYLRLKLLEVTSRGTGEVSFLGYRIRYLNAESLFQLYREIFVHRYYDLPVKSESPQIIDCGSNIGMSVIFFKNKYPKARIIGFEPHPATFRTLRENIERNRFQHIDVYQQALSDRCGTIDFYVNNDGQGLEALEMSIIAGREATPIQVPTNQLSAYVDGEVDLLKLDIEGAEELVLKDLEDHGKLRSFRRIICEYHHHRDSTVDRLSRTLSLLEKAGFGYQLNAYRNFDTKEATFQDVLIYAYRK